MAATCSLLIRVLGANVVGLVPLLYLVYMLLIPVDFLCP